MLFDQHEHLDGIWDHISIPMKHLHSFSIYSTVGRTPYVDMKFKYFIQCARGWEYAFAGCLSRNTNFVFCLYLFVLATVGDRWQVVTFPKGTESRVTRPNILFWAVTQCTLTFDGLRNIKCIYGLCLLLLFYAIKNEHFRHVICDLRI